MENVRLQLRKVFVPVPGSIFRLNFYSQYSLLLYYYVSVAQFKRRTNSRLLLSAHHNIVAHEKKTYAMKREKRLFTSQPADIEKKNRRYNVKQALFLFARNKIIDTWVLLIWNWHKKNSYCTFKVHMTNGVIVSSMYG